MSEKTLGEKRIRTEFNPSSNSRVDEIKQKTAELINCVNLSVLFENSEEPEVKEKNNEKRRLIALSLTAYEEAAMWAVKAATA